jgi:antitoxin component YwqK of YwqJK toxin-antitoxin module
MKHAAIILILGIVACGTEKHADPAADADEPASSAPLAQPAPKGDKNHQEFYPEGGLKMEGTLKDGKRHGLWTSYGKNGKVKSRSEYVMGVTQGPTVVYNENGDVFYTGTYSDGKPSGIWRFYNSKGEEEKVIDYNQGS